MKPFRIAKVEPIGQRPATGFVTRTDGSCGVDTLSLPVYPPHPRGISLGAERIDLDLGLREAAALLGMTALDLGSVEHGRATFTDDGDWERAVLVWRSHRSELP